MTFRLKSFNIVKCWHRRLGKRYGTKCPKKKLHSTLLWKYYRLSEDDNCMVFGLKSVTRNHNNHTNKIDIIAWIFSFYILSIHSFIQSVVCSAHHSSKLKLANNSYWKSFRDGNNAHFINEKIYSCVAKHFCMLHLTQRSTRISKRISLKQLNVVNPQRWYICIVS